MRKKPFWLTFLTLFLDVALIALAFYLAYLIRFKFLIEEMPGSVPIVVEYTRMAIFAILLWIASFKIANLYDRKNSYLIDEIALLFLVLSFGAALFLGLLYLYKEFGFSRQVILYVWLFSLGFLTASRIALFLFQRLLFALGIGKRKVLILGADDLGQSLALKMKKDTGLGYQLVGFVDDDPLRQGKQYLGIPVLGDTKRLKALIKEKQINEVVVAGSNLSSQEILHIITECETLGIEFKIIPGLLEILASRVDIDEIGGIPLVTIGEIQWKGFKAWLKRGADIFCSSLLLLILSPFFLLAVILIKLDSPGPIFFAQERVGKDGTTFKMLKFRSMVANAEELFPSLKEFSEVEGHIFKMKEDPRITRIGKWMRRFSVDEWPQFINVFLGQMSLVGPRPPIPREVKEYNEWQMKRLRIAPGITGLWQVSGRSELPFEDMVRLDIYYIENWSLW
ncbi:MAG: sugar transferase [Candidatus Saganbacteria bacterium]|nr:sugar transferase [Candidatus Saganbacteria bacterium]